MKLSHEELCELWLKSRRKVKDEVRIYQRWVYVLDCDGQLDFRRDETCPTSIWFKEMDERYGEGE